MDGCKECKKKDVEIQEASEERRYLESDVEDLTAEISSLEANEDADIGTFFSTVYECLVLKDEVKLKSILAAEIYDRIGRIV